MGFFSKIFGKKSKAEIYEAEKNIALSDNVKDRLKVAKNPKTHQEILFYMAQTDGSAEVRLAVAGNKATPVQASGVLSKDKSEDVRLALAGRLAALLPDLSSDKQGQLYKFAVDALGNLALDEVLKVRVALSSALKECADTPPSVAGQLARDVEREVSEPILRFCIALSDDDLLDILKSHPASWAVQAVASRPRIAAPVSQAVIDTNDVAAGQILMENKGADISLETLKDIVEKSKQYPEWQKPIAMKKSLPPELVRELAGFVDLSVRNILMERTDFDAELMDDVSSTVQRRMDYMDQADNETLEQRALRLYKTGKLNDEVFGDALSMRDKDFVSVGLAVLLKTNKANIDKIFAMGAAKPVVAICWKAGLSMRFALRLQQDMAKVPHTELIYPRGGTDYPLSEADLKWQLEFLGLS
ncbi:MAG: hypothetical protein A3B66_07805 [Alphaproteobacteria bacterium RIFCSPHIGHO2_02_FULL_46_13]|nr:MAG: hypothetical protein A3B66_07805 [Alphaproteobacteria bacterium RIFCSPHIGHO2_02_FULL_46_13]